MSSSKTFVERSPIYYGWIVVFVSMIGIIASMPGQTANVSLFIDQWIEDFGLDDRSTISALYGAGTFLASLSLTFIGNRLDKYGSRTVGVIIVVLFSLAMVFISQARNLIMLMIGFMLIRALGQGALMIIHVSAVSQWFKRLRGRMIAVLFVAFGLYQRPYIPIVQWLTENYSWRTVWLMLAGFTLIVVVPIIGLFMREKPEMFGLLPDGDTIQPTEEEKEAERKRDAEANYSLREAVQLPIFWVFLLGKMMTPMFITGIVFHQESLFSVNGYSAAIAAATIANGFVISALINIPAGFLVDRFRPSFVLAFELAALIGVVVFSNLLPVGWLIYVWTLLFGMVMGVSGVFAGALWVDLFGRGHQGEIRGFASMVGVTGTALGPFFLALSYDAFGDYTVSLYIGAALILIPLIAGLFMNRPRPRAAIGKAMGVTST